MHWRTGLRLSRYSSCKTTPFDSRIPNFINWMTVKLTVVTRQGGMSAQQRMPVYACYSLVPLMCISCISTNIALLRSLFMPGRAYLAQRIAIETSHLARDVGWQGFALVHGAMQIYMGFVAIIVRNYCLLYLCFDATRIWRYYKSERYCSFTRRPEAYLYTQLVGINCLKCPVNNHP